MKKAFHARIDGAACGTSSKLFRTWADALEFPEYFGQNWDAFEECISDLEWLPHDVEVEIAAHHSLLAEEPGRRLTLTEILEDAAKVHASHGRRFVVRFDDG